jgi:transcriptional regulator with XRE-family HTH domain
MATSKDTAKVVALKRFMETQGLKPHPWAQAAGLRSSTLYNFLSGKSLSLSGDTLERLAKAAGSTVDEILSGEKTNNIKRGSPVSVPYTVGVYGRLFEMDRPLQVQRPAGVPDEVEVLAARIDGDGLHPVPGGWLVYFEALPRDAETLIGKLCVVQVAGGQRLIREIRKGQNPGLYTLLSWSASPMENAQVQAAHLVISIAQITIPV